MSFRDKFKGLIPEDKAKDADAVFDELDKVLDGQAKDLRELKTQLRQKDGIKPEDLAALEQENATLKSQNAELSKAAKKFETDAKGAAEKLTAEQKRIQNLEVDRALTESLTKAKVKPELLAAAKALLRDGITLEPEGDAYKAVAKWKDKDGKDSAGSHSDFIDKNWTQGEGKAFILADGNGGSGGREPGRQQGGKTIPRADFDAKNPAEKAALIKEGVRPIDA